MRRRELITLIGGAAAWSLTARADGVRRVGVLIATVESDPEGQARAAALRQSLETLGWTESRTIRIDTRWGADEDQSRAWRGRAATSLASPRPSPRLV
jgi:putative ABC transport system substrate-binding protein